MKNIRFVTLLLSALLLGAGNAEAQVRLNIGVELPGFVRNLGVGPRTILTVSNPTRFYAWIVAAGDPVPGCYGPGTSLYDRYSWEFEETELPIVAFLYEDENCERLVAVSGTVLRVRGGEPVNWTIGSSALHYPDGRRGHFGGFNRSPYPAADAGGSVKVDFARIDWCTATGIQIVNATLFEASIRLQGAEVARLSPGSIYYAEKEPRWGDRVLLRLEVQFIDRDRFVGYYERQLSIDTHQTGREASCLGPKAIQHILHPDEIGLPRQ